MSNTTERNINQLQDHILSLQRCLQQVQEAINMQENAAQNIDTAWRHLLDQLAVVARTYGLEVTDPYRIARLENMVRFYRGEELQDIPLVPAPEYPILQIRKMNDINYAKKQQLIDFLRAHGSPANGNLRELKLEACDVVGFPEKEAKSVFSFPSH